MARKKPGKRRQAPEPGAPEMRTHYPVTPEEFALTWNSCDSADEVAEKLRMPKAIVQARVSNYRKKGVNLKRMPRKNSRKLDVEGINRVLEKAGGPNDTASSAPPQLTPKLVDEILKAIERGLKSLLRPPRDRQG